MVKSKDFTFLESKKLPTIQILRDDYGIEYNTVLQRFEKKLSNSALFTEGYSLTEFISDYYLWNF